MKVSIGKTLVLLAIALSFTAVQGVWAELNTVTVVGIVSLPECEGSEITVIDSDGNETYIYRVPFNYLAENGIELTEGVYVIIEAYPLTYKNGKIKYIACTVTVDDITVQVRDENLIPVWSNKNR